jgi:hypothetical protein
MPYLIQYETNSMLAEQITRINQAPYVRGVSSVASIYKRVERQDLIYATLVRIHPKVSDIYLGIFPSLNVSTPDYAAKLCFSIRRVIDIASKVIIGNVSDLVLKQFLQDRKKWNNRCCIHKKYPNMYTRLIYVSEVYDDSQITPDMIDKVMDFYEKMCGLHETELTESYAESVWLHRYPR